MKSGGCQTDGLPILAFGRSRVAFLALFTGVLCFQTSAQVFVWNLSSQLLSNTPPDLTNVMALAAGDSHFLALRTNGTVVAWGDNGWGEANVPSDLTNAVGIAAGSHHSLALRKDGTVALWGSIFDSWVTNVPSELTNIVGLALGSGAQHAVALRSDGTPIEWASTNYGLADIPSAARNVVAISAGAYHSMALRSDGRVVAWGSAPSVPASATNIVAIASGWYGDAGLRADGTVLVWGSSQVPPSSSGFSNVIDLACPFDAFFTGNSMLALRSDGSLTEYSVAIPAYPTNAITAVAAASDFGVASVGSGPPVFPGLPVDRTVSAGSPAYFRMTASGLMPIAYQWIVNGTNFSGATNSILTVTNVQPNLAGAIYALIASNSAGMTTSGPVSLHVTPSEVDLQATTLTAVVGQIVTFTASMVGQGPFTYQWRFNGTNLPGATNLVLSLNYAQLPDAGAYSIVVSNNFGLVTNFLVLTVAPTIVTNSLVNQIGFPGGTAALSIGLESIIPVSYRWQFNGTNLDGATNSSLTLTNLLYSNAGTYSVIYTDAFENVTNYATLSIVPVAAWGSMGQQSLIPDLTNLLAVASGEAHGLALRTDGTVVGWGNNISGEAVAPPGLSNVIAIDAGDNHSLALRSDGTVVAWGINSNGETNVPGGLTSVVAISAGVYHDLALRADGTVVAWGDNSYGQTNVPPNLTNAVAIAAGQYNSMALTADGRVIAWGAGTNNSSYPNYGQSVVPTNVANVVQIATGGADDISLSTDGSIVGWGYNFSGEDNPPAGLSNVVAIAAGYEFSVALESDGTVTSWGYNYFAYSQTNVPAGLSNVISITARGDHTTALIGTRPPILQAQLSDPRVTSNVFGVSIPSQSGRVYALEYKSALSDSNWTALPLVAGNGGKLLLTDRTVNNGQRFYRVRRW